MPRIRYLRVRFSNNIQPYEIPFFRSAIIEKTERAASLFHNHANDTEVIYRYPLIQYKVNHKKASIVCLNQGTDDIHHLLRHQEMELRIGDYTKRFEVEDIILNYHQVQTWQASFEYSLLNWMGLNQANHAKYMALEGDIIAQTEFLENILRANILSFAKGIGWYLTKEEEIKVRIKDIKSRKTLPFKKKRVLTFCVNFVCNVSLPNYMGLGKGTSIGFGIVKKIDLNKKSK